MMKNRKKLAGLIAVMTAALILLTACGGGNIEGTWRIVKLSGTGFEGLEVTASDNMTITFRDGTYTMAVQGEEFDRGPYKTEGNKLTWDGDLTEYSVNGNKLQISFSDGTMYLER